MDKSSQVKSWLASFQLDEYTSKFISNGFDSLETVKLMDDSDFAALGIDKRGHLKRLQHEVSLLKQQGPGAGLSMDDANTLSLAKSLSAPPSTPAPLLSTGQFVLATWMEGKRMFSGKISAVNKDGTYAIIYDDGDYCPKVEPKNVVPYKPIHADISQLEKGSVVEARWKGRQTYFRGVIEQINPNGTYGVHYDDGDVETSVPLHLIRIPEDIGVNLAASMSVPLLAEGTFVQAVWKESNKYFSGKIVSVNADKTYGILFDDGDYDARCPRTAVHEYKPVYADISQLKVDTKVHARWRGRQTYFPGTITAIKPNGTYSIRYDDNDFEASVPIHLIKLAAGTEDELKVGVAIEARWKGGVTWFSGKISKVNDNGTFYINYNDGDVEDQVSRHLIRVIKN